MRPWKPDQPYNQISKLPPTKELETKQILKLCIEARSALAELKQAAELIPNQGMLINTLPMLESQASSEIENIVTTTDRLFQYSEASELADPSTREALSHRDALLEGYRDIKKHPLNTRTAEGICSRVKRVDMQVRYMPGTALLNQATGEIIYTPPTGKDLIRDLLANWEKFMHENTDLDPLIRLAVGHYQFEAIHPFTDGNGRTGRIINSLFLIQEELLNLPILYLSRYFIKNRTDYYRLLLGVTSEGAWEPWLSFVISGVRETSKWTTEKISAIKGLSDHTVEYVRQAAPKIYTREIVDLIFEFPYCRIQKLVERKIAGRQAASRYLKQLVKIGVLEEQQVGREKLFIHPKLMRLLTQDTNQFLPYSKG